MIRDPFYSISPTVPPHPPTCALVMACGECMLVPHGDWADVVTSNLDPPISAN